MGLISTGIDKVRAFELAGGIWADGENVGAVRVALVTWRSVWSDKLYQVYVNGEYGGVTLETSQRQMVVRVGGCSDGPVEIAVYAVSELEADVDFSYDVDGSLAKSGRVKITLLRSQVLPVGASAQVYYDNGTGVIDYDEALNEMPIRIWPAWQDKGGFGMSMFGYGDLGFDSAAAVGFGKGAFGYGQLGLDADTIEWVSPRLAAGDYEFCVKIEDESGNLSGGSLTGAVTVTPAAIPAERVSVGSFDKVTNQLVLNVV